MGGNSEERVRWATSGSAHESFSFVPVNVALRKHTKCGSSYLNWYMAPRANDGLHLKKLNEKSCYSSSEKNPLDLEWWSVDLGRQYVIRKFSYHIRQDGFREFVHQNFLSHISKRDNLSEASAKLIKKSSQTMNMQMIC